MGCVAAIVAPVFNGRDNTIQLVLFQNGSVLADLSPLTRVVVDLDGSTIIDSDIVGSSVIWWTDEQTYRGLTVDVLSLRLGGQGVAVGSYDDVSIVIYDAIYTNGLKLESDVKLTFQ